MPWKHGPMPEDTWNWGGVVLKDDGRDCFHFADFHGDHVTLVPDGRRIEPEEILLYNNCLELPKHSRKIKGRA